MVSDSGRVLDSDWFADWGGIPESGRVWFSDLGGTSDSGRVLDSERFWDSGGASDSESLDTLGFLERGDDIVGAGSRVPSMEEK